jgi:hypothetical protein
VAPRGLRRRLGTARHAAVAAVVGLVVMAFAGCSLFSSSAGKSAPGDGKPAAENGAGNPPPPGVLGALMDAAPPGSPTQFLAGIAGQLGWEEQVAEDVTLRKAIQEKKFDETVLPMLLALFYGNGFSVLGTVGEGHQFTRDTVVRSGVGTGRLLVNTREEIRIIFLSTVENAQVVYPQDGQPPVVFAVVPTAVVAVRQSLLEHYLR